MPRPIESRDEQVHPVDPDDWWWSESWFFSFIDLDGGPAGFFRVGVLPNQGRAMLWMFLHVDGSWYGREESRLALSDVDLTDGLRYDRWGLRFGWQPTRPLEAGRFDFEGTLLQRTGAESAPHVPVRVELDCTATAAPIPTAGSAEDRETTVEAQRLERPLEATGTAVVGGRSLVVRAGAHRDRSWGPRDWRVAFTLGDLQAEGRQLYFVGRAFPGLGGGFVRTGDGPVEHVVALATSTVDYDDGNRTIGGGRLAFQGEGDTRFDVTLRPIAPSVTFDMAHTCDQPEHWLYLRTLVEATVDGWDGPCRGWFETSRYGTS